MNNQSKLFKITASILIVLFSNLALFPGCSQAASGFLSLPSPKQFTTLSSTYSLPILKGIKLNPDNPLKIDFIIDTASKGDVDEEEASRLIRYFLAGLTLSEKELWVNLSPYEKERVAPETLALTDLGKDMLSQDYILKQLLASLTYPESKIGKDYWQKTYQEVAKIAGTANIPINAFNKVWIMPDKCVVYEKGNVAFVSQASMKAMMEQDYVALRHNQPQGHTSQATTEEEFNQVASKIMKELVLPKIQDDINHGKNFATLRQIYHSLVLSVWFKQKFKNSFYKHYIEQEKIKGIDLEDKGVKDKIYSLYVEAYKKGVYNYIKEEFDLSKRKYVRRRYFSGGITTPSTINTQVISVTADEIVTLCASDRMKYVAAMGQPLVSVSSSIGSQGNLAEAIRRAFGSRQEAVFQVSQQELPTQKVIVFDWDGVIADSLGFIDENIPRLYYIVTQGLDIDKNIKVPDEVVAETKQFMANHKTATFYKQVSAMKEVAINRGVSSKRLKSEREYLEGYMGWRMQVVRANPDKWAFPGAKHTLLKLKERNPDAIFYVLSNTTTDQLREEARILEVDHIFTEIIGSSLDEEEIPTDKVISLERIKEKHKDVAVSAITMVGDGSSDGIAAKAANVNFLAIANQQKNVDGLLETKPAWLATSMKPAAQIVEALNPDSSLVKKEKGVDSIIDYYGFRGRRLQGDYDKFYKNLGDRIERDNAHIIAFDANYGSGRSTMIYGKDGLGVKGLSLYLEKRFGCQVIVIVGDIFQISRKERTQLIEGLPDGQVINNADEVFLNQELYSKYLRKMHSFFNSENEEGELQLDPLPLDALGVHYPEVALGDMYRFPPISRKAIILIDRVFAFNQESRKFIDIGVFLGTRDNSVNLERILKRTAEEKSRTPEYILKREKRIQQPTYKRLIEQEHYLRDFNYVILNDDFKNPEIYEASSSIANNTGGVDLITTSSALETRGQGVNIAFDALLDNDLTGLTFKVIFIKDISATELSKLFLAD